MSNLAEKVKEEIKNLVPPTLFFFIALHLVAYIRALMLEGTTIGLATSASVTVAALVLGKAVLIADLLPIINRFPEKPLVYNIVWKAIIYFLVALIFHYLERLIEFSREAGGLIAGNERLIAQIVWPHFWGIQIVLMIWIGAYCVMDELSRVIGGERMRRMFFGPMEK